MFGMCSFFLLVCLLCQRQFASIVHYEQAGSHFDEDNSGVEGGKVTEFTKLATEAAPSSPAEQPN